jgi:protein phosphatase
MKTILVTILSVCIYFLVNLFIIATTDSTLGRKILYYYPNGYVLNANSSNKHFIGYNLFKDADIPEIKFNENELNFFLESSFFINLVPFRDFYPYFIVSHLLFAVGIWFLLRSGDILFSNFFTLAGIFISSNFFLLYYGSYYFLFFTSLAMMWFILIHLVIRIKGHDVPTKWYILEISISIIIGFIGSSSPENSSLFEKLSIFFTWGFFLVSWVAFSVLVYDVIKYKLFSKENTQLESNFKKKLYMGILVCAIGWIPFLVIKLNLIQTFAYTLEFLFFGLLAFPFIFIYASYGVSYLPQQLVFTSAISYLFQVAFYVLVYFLFWFILRKFFVIHPKILDYFHIMYLTLVIFIGVSVKNEISTLIEKLNFSRHKNLTTTLQEMVKIITEPLFIRNTLKKLLIMATEALKVKKVLVLIPSGRFQGMEKMKDVGIISVREGSPIWQYFSKEKDITITSYLSYGSGIREELFRYLSSLEVQIAYPMFSSSLQNSPTSVLLIGEKNDKKNFSIAELQFIKECSRLGNLLLENYMLVVSDIETRKVEKNLEQVQLKTNNTLLDTKIFGNIEIAHVLLPAMGISGDYLDLFENSNEIKIFLGDVSGHGMGSGYMVSSVKALISSLVSENYSIIDIFKNVNKLLIERFPGNLFMSLIGGIYNVNTSEFTFINAGHLHPMLFHLDGKMELIRTPDRVLGITSTNFNLETIQLREGDRLVIFSDGVTETFNPKEEIYGMARLETCIHQNFQLPTQELIQKIIADLKEFRQGSDLSDDLTLICLTRLNKK